MTAESKALERFDPADKSWDALQRDLHLFRYEFAKPYVEGKRVLDVACGTGFGCKLLTQSAAAVVGVDCDPATIKRARKAHIGTAIQFETQDAEDLRFKQTFDAIVSFETIEHLHHPNRMLATLPLILDPVGVFLVSSPVRRQGTLEDKPANPFHVREWTVDEFRTMLESYFASVEIFGQWMEFERGPFPLARTLKCWISTLVRPSTLSRIHNAWPKPIEPRLPFAIKIAYMVAVCQGLR